MVQSWNGLTSLQALLLDHNALTGFLPSTWGSLDQLQVLSIGMALAAESLLQSVTFVTVTGIVAWCRPAVTKGSFCDGAIPFPFSITAPGGCNTQQKWFPAPKNQSWLQGRPLLWGLFPSTGPT